MFTDYNKTKISKRNMKKLRNKSLSAKKIVEYLNTGATFHTFQYLLEKTYPCENLQAELIEGLCHVSDRSQETISRNVRNWLNGKVSPTREDIFQLGFVLHLSLENVDQLLGACADTGIHYRNPKELIYCYGLKNELSWKEVIEIRDRLLPICQVRMNDVQKLEVYKEMARKRTRQIEADFVDRIHNEADLEAFLLDQAPYLGYLHLTAYEDFMKMIRLLQKIDSKDDKLSVNQIVEKYLKFEISKNATCRENEYLAKTILKNWPSSNIIYKMQTRRQDVTRKMMILLFLVTEEFMVVDSLWGANDEEHIQNRRYQNTLKKDYLWNPDDILEVRIKMMNMYLDRYGMNLLNPGLPFDCVVLYALKASYEDQKSMSDRLKDVLQKLFDEENKN